MSRRVKHPKERKGRKVEAKPTSDEMPSRRVGDWERDRRVKLPCDHYPQVVAGWTVTHTEWLAMQ